MSLLGRHAWLLLPLLTISLTLSGCETTPVTQRSQLVLLSEPQAAEMGQQAYREILTKSRVVAGTAFKQQVDRVGARIAGAVGKDLAWEFNVIQDDTPNAFALPGGKVGVHTGLSKVVRNDDQLAAVLAHEIAHVTARHSAERVSQQLLVQGGLAGLGQAAGGETARLAAAAATLGIVLPFSRAQEAEADEIGLHYMARAKYDPRAAIEVWQNFQKLGGDRSPEFLSTHPSPGNRIARLQRLLPTVMPIYQSQKQSR